MSNLQLPHNLTELLCETRWEIIRFKHGVQLINDKAENIFNYVGLENVESWTGKLIKNIAELVEEEAATGNRFYATNVLFGKLRPYLAKAFVAEEDGCCTSELLVFRPLHYDSKYLKYLILTPDFVNLVNSSTYGVKMPRTNWEFIGNISIPKPPLSVQQTIASFLDRKTAAIATLIAKKQRLIQLLEEKRTALINQAVTKGLNPNVPMKDSGIPWIGEVPQHWNVKPLKFVCRLETGHTPRKSEATYWVPGECTIPWVSLNDTKTLEANDFIEDTKLKISKFGMANSSAHLIKAGAVVFNRDGARVGLAAIMTKPMAVSQHIIAWVCGSEVDNRFILHVMYAMALELRRITAGATIPTIGMDDVKSMVSPIPPIHEQHEIISHIIRQRNLIDQITTNISQQIEKLQEYRQSLITAAVTGKINVAEEVIA